MLRKILMLISSALFLAALPAVADEYRRLTADDLAVQTHKWDGKKIEVQLRCFFADKNDYRCALGNTRLDLLRISNDIGRDHLEDHCDTISKLTRPECLVLVRFVYNSFDSMRTPSRQEMTVVIAQDFVGEVILPEVRKRR